MSKYIARIDWQKKADESFTDNTYSRLHEWNFDGGVVVPASASPSIVPLPYSVAEAVDPEEAYVASLASCHMLFFLSIAAKRKYVVLSYSDDASGIMENNSEGLMAMTEVTLNPVVSFDESIKPAPDQSQLERLHHLAHKQCFIANSVKSEIVVNLSAQGKR